MKFLGIKITSFTKENTLGCRIEEMSNEMALITQQGICGGKGALSDRVHSMLI